MKKINVLFITYSFPPAQSPAALRIYYFLKYLELDYFNPIVITPKISDSSLGYSNSLSWISKKARIYETCNFYSKKIRNLRAFVQGRKKEGFKSVVFRCLYGFLFPDKGVTWLPCFLRDISKVFLENRIDVVFSSSPLFTNHMLAMYVKKRYKIPWVADFRDLHYIGNIEFDRSIFLRKLHRLLEKKILLNLDRAIFISKTMEQLFLSYYLFLNGKTHVIYNGFDLDEFKEIPEDIEKLTKVRILYAGSFYGKLRNPWFLIRALEILVKRYAHELPDFEVIVLGNVNNDVRVIFERSSIKEKIKCMGIVNRKKVLYYMKNSHFLWLIIPDVLSHKIGIPSKAYEYIAAGRHILAFVPEDSEASSLIKNYGLGTLFSQDISRLEENVNKLYLIFKNYKNLYRIDRNLEGDLSLYSRKYQAKQLMEILKNVVSEANEV